MAAEEDTLIQQERTSAPVVRKKKKTVSWSDHQSEGKISEQYLQIGQSASLSKKALGDKMKQLVDKEGYSELEAAAFTGKPKTLSGEVILNEPTFYFSPEEIQQQVAEKKALASTLGRHAKSSRNSFFETNMIRIGMPTIDGQEEIKRGHEKEEKRTALGGGYAFFGAGRPLLIGMTSQDTSTIMALAQFNYSSIKK